MGMPQNAAYENRIFRLKKSEKRLISATEGSKIDSGNEDWSGAGLALLMPSEQYPRKRIPAAQAPAINLLHRWLGGHDSQVTFTLGTGPFEVLATGLLNHVGDVDLGIHESTCSFPI